MSNFIIDGIDFVDLPAEKYWSFPKTYKGDKKAETKEMVLSENYLGSLKNDGHYARFIKDMNGNMWLQGRTPSVDGQFYNKIDWVPQCKHFFESLPNGTCLLGELYFPDKRGSRNVTTILGCLKNKAIERQELNERLHYYIFDVWAYDGKSLLDTKMEKRVEQLYNIDYPNTEYYIERATYYKGQELWDELGKILKSGGEGMVITKINSTPDPGKRPARKTLKIKMEIENTIDVFLDGNYKLPTRLYGGKEIENWKFWENIKTNERTTDCMFREYNTGGAWEPVTKAYFYNWASAVSISVMRDGVPFHIGYISGIPDEMKRDIVTKNEEYKYKVYEVTCMEVEHIGNDYSLRHGKFVKERPDKNYEDCDFAQISQ